MANTVIALKKSGIPSAIPSDLANGELAINYADGKIFYKSASGTIQEISGGGAGGNSFGTVNANGILVVADTSGDVLTLNPGTNIDITADPFTDTITISATANLTPAFDQANIAGAIGSAAFDQANSANLLAYNTGIGANAFTSDTIAGANTAVGTGANAYSDVVGTSANAFASATIAGANTAVGTGANSYADIVGTSANAFTSATIAGANTAVGTGANAYSDVVGTSANLYADTVGTSANAYASIVGSSANTHLLSVISGANTAVGAGANAYSATVGISANAFTSDTVAGANTAVGAGANAYANLVWSRSNTFASSVGTSANAFASATIAGANTAVGAGANAYADIVGSSANAFASATIAGANTAVGTAANNFASATIAGANTAVGAGANSYADTVGTSANTFTSATIAGANTSVGAGANAYANLVWSRSNSFTSATIAGANTAVGAGANAFASATIAGANTAVGTGANNYSNATFVRLDAPNQTITGNLAIVGNLTLSGNTVFINASRLEVDDPLIYLAGNNYTSDIVDIGFIANYVNATGSNVHTGLYREHENKMYYLFNGYDREPINNHIGAMSNNMTLAVLNADMITSNLTLGGQNTILWIRSAYDQANAANVLAFNTGIGVNSFTSATIAGANTAVGAGANAYSTTVGTSANAFTSATIAGANTAVGAGANSYANLVWSRSNSFTSATIAGANAAVGAGANTVGSAAFLQANTARDIAIAAYANANSKFSSSGGAINGDITLTGSLYVKAQGGIEGGQIELANATTSSTLAGNVVIDIYGNKLRFYEKDSPNKGAFIDLSITGASVGTNLMSSSGTSGLANTDGITFGGTLIVSANLSADKVLTSNNSYGENFRVGDDAWIGDTNIADTIRIKGQQNPSNGWIMFGTNDGILLGRNGSNALTYGGSTIWHSGNDGSGSGLDADLLDGQNGAYYAASATLAGANTAVGAGANAYANLVWSRSNSFISATIAGANTAVGAGANAFTSATVSGANTIAIAAFNRANSGAKITLSDNAPSSPTVGDLWWSSLYGELYVYYTDADSTQWVSTVGAAGGGYTLNSQIYDTANLAITTANFAYDTSNAAFIKANLSSGIANAGFTVANISFTAANAGFTAANAGFTAANAGFTTANAAFLRANNALPNTTVTLAGNLTTVGNVSPVTTGAYDLGSASLRWRNIFTNDLNLSNGIGDYTIVEGEENLFIYNNKSGKVFKFALIEVDPKEAPPKAGES